MHPPPSPALLVRNHEAVFSRRDHRGRQISYLLSCCTQIAKLASPEDAVSPERARCRARGKCARTSGAPRLITGKIFFFSLLRCMLCVGLRRGHFFSHLSIPAVAARTSAAKLEPFVSCNTTLNAPFFCFFFSPASSPALISALLFRVHLIFLPFSF